MKMRISIFICIVFALTTQAYSNDQKEYVSPNGQYIAIVTSTQKSTESKIVIKTKNGIGICSKGYTSKDSTHGFRIEKAIWTPDSRFFVYSMSSSGGHQPWHFPIDFCSISESSIKNLDKYVGPITNSQLEVKAPDIIKGVRMKKNIDNQEEFEVSLSHLVKLKNK